MRFTRKWMIALLPVLGCGMLWLSGCDKKVEDAGAGAGAGKPKKPGAKAAKIAGYATLKGKVTYNGDAAAMGPKKIPQTKETQEHCPSMVNGEGWYVKDPATKGLRYAVVFLKPPSGVRMPKYDEEKSKPPSPFAELRQPKCEFEPRVQVMHPAQSLKAYNDSNIPHDTNLDGPGKMGRTMPKQSDYVFTIEPANAEPYKLSCNIHQGIMHGYIWKFDHPWAATTDENGNYEIKDVPVLDSGALDVWVWHEMLPSSDNKMKKVGSQKGKDGETTTVDITLPN